MLSVANWIFQDSTSGPLTINCRRQWCSLEAPLPIVGRSRGYPAKQDWPFAPPRCEQMDDFLPIIAERHALHQTLSKDKRYAEDTFGYGWMLMRCDPL